MYRQCQQATQLKQNQGVMASTEQDAEQRFQYIKYLLKQLGGNVKSCLSEEKLQSVTAYLVSTEAQALLNEVVRLQALYNCVTIESTTQLTLKNF